MLKKYYIKIRPETAEIDSIAWKFGNLKVSANCTLIDIDWPIFKAS